MVVGVADVVGMAAEQQSTPNFFRQIDRQIERSVIEALAEDAHFRADLGAPFPDPTWLAQRNNFVLWATMTPPDCGSFCCAQTLFYRPGLRRTSGGEIYHAFAHGLLSRYGEPHGHQDVTLLALALMAPRPAVLPLLRGSTLAQATRALIRRHIHAPTVLLRLRLQQVWLSTTPSPLVRFC